MPNSSTRNGETDATDWNWKPMATRPKASTASIIQRLDIDNFRKRGGSQAREFEAAPK